MLPVPVVLEFTNSGRLSIYVNTLSPALRREQAGRKGGSSRTIFSGLGFDSRRLHRGGYSTHSLRNAMDAWTLVEAMDKKMGDAPD